MTSQNSSLNGNSFNESSPSQALKTPNPNKDVRKGAGLLKWRLSPHEGKAYAKYSNVYERQLNGRVQAEIAKGNTYSSDAMRLAAVVPEPPTDHYLKMQWKWGLNDMDATQQRKNWIAFLKSSDGSRYRVIPANKI